MPLYEIHKHELAAYGERQRRGELLIHGMAVTPTGYRLHLTMTPRVADAMKFPSLAPKPEAKTPPATPQAQETASPKPLPSSDTWTSPLREGRERPEGVSAPVMEPLCCPFCTNQLETDGTCSICHRMAKIAGAAAERRRAWHIFKKGQGPRPI